MSILEWIAHAKREFWNARRRGGNLFCFVVPLYAKTLDDLTRPTQLEIVENECLFIGELSEHRKLGRNCYCCLDSRFAKDGRGGVLSEIKRVVNIPGYNNNLVQNEEFSPHLGKPSPTFPPTTSCIIRWKIAGGDLCEWSLWLTKDNREMAIVKMVKDNYTQVACIDTGWILIKWPEDFATSVKWLDENLEFLLVKKRERKGLIENLNVEEWVEWGCVSIIG